MRNSAIFSITIALCAVAIVSATTVEIKQKHLTDAIKGMKPSIQIWNKTTSSMPVTSVKVRYYFYEPTLTPAQMHYTVWYFNQGGSDYSNHAGNALVSFYAYDDGSPASGDRANMYAEMSFTGSYTIPANDYATIEVRLYKDESFTFTESDDWSYNGVTGNPVLNPNTVAVNQSGVILYGTPPVAVVVKTLTLSFNGAGTSNSAVRVTVPGQSPVNYTANTTVSYSDNPTITIEAVAAGVKRFDHWTVDGTTSSATSFTLAMTDDHSVTAYFVDDYLYPMYTGAGADCKIDGKLFIGIPAASSDAKLTVKDGDIKVMNGDLVITDGGKVVVNNWTIEEVPDYVFDPSYTLPDLSEVEQFVKTEKHLPEVPSANEFNKSGIDLAAMNMVLLKKIEQLTLYSIEHKNQLKKQQELIDELRKRVESLSK
jgi:hypothetical protein